MIYWVLINLLLMWRFICQRNKILCRLRTWHAAHGSSAKSYLRAIHRLCFEEPVLRNGDAHPVWAFRPQPFPGNSERPRLPAREMNLRFLSLPFSLLLFSKAYQFLISGWIQSICCFGEQQMLEISYDSFREQFFCSSLYVENETVKTSSVCNEELSDDQFLCTNLLETFSASLCTRSATALCFLAQWWTSICTEGDL